MWSTRERENLLIIKIFLVRANRRIKCPFTEVKKTKEGTGLRRKIKVLFWK